MDIGRVDEIKTAFDDDNKSASETEKTETISENCVEDQGWPDPPSLQS